MSKYSQIINKNMNRGLGDTPTVGHKIYLSRREINFIRSEMLKIADKNSSGRKDASQLQFRKRNPRGKLASSIARKMPIIK